MIAYHRFRQALSLRELVWFLVHVLTSQGQKVDCSGMSGLNFSITQISTGMTNVFGLKNEKISYTNYNNAMH